MVEQPRGARPYSTEIDLGFGGALRAAATVVAEDPLFGLIAYGGKLRNTGTSYEVIPLDGLGRRFHIIRNNLHFHLLLDHNGFAAFRPVSFNEKLTELDLENRAPLPAKHHQTETKNQGTARRKIRGPARWKNYRNNISGKMWEKVRLPIGPRKEISVLIK